MASAEPADVLPSSISTVEEMLAYIKAEITKATVSRKPLLVTSSNDVESKSR